MDCPECSNQMIYGAPHCETIKTQKECHSCGHIEAEYYTATATNDDFWGEPISVYTDSDAINDGIIIDVSDLEVKFNGLIINRATVGAVLASSLKEKDAATARNNLQFIADNCSFDGEGEDAWGVFQPDKRLGNTKFWLVPNEVKGYTIMLPSDY